MIAPPAQIDQLNDALAGRYRLERPLGEGGMATVYLAQDLRHNRHVALKVLKPELAEALGAQRFLKEIEVTANLQHPHILPLYDSGSAGGALFYVMPLMRVVSRVPTGHRGYPLVSFVLTVRHLHRSIECELGDSTF